MTFKSAVWYPVSIVLSAINLVAVGFAAGEPEPYHAAAHAGLALGFGLWAQRLGMRRRANQLEGSAEMLDALDAVETEVNRLRQDLTETQERLDFTERMLARESEIRRVDPQH
jgi:hypothetical protein